MQKSRKDDLIERLETLEVSLFSTNCYVLKVAGGPVVVVDPGGEADRIVEFLGEIGEPPAYILCTHAHLDHVEAAGAVKARSGGAIVLHRDDLPLWEGVGQQARMFMLPAPVRLPPPDILASGGETLSVGPLSIEICHVPGHSPGSVAYLIRDAGIGFNGDTVFAMGVGRTDLWGGSGAQLRASLLEKLFTLPPSFVLYPGHGSSVTVKQARRNEEFLDLL
jgi:hydroxyacylglutathione hydrolase